MGQIVRIPRLNPLPPSRVAIIYETMSKRSDIGPGGKAALAGAIGSAAIAAAVMFVNKRKERDKKKRFTTPFNEPPETD